MKDKLDAYANGFCFEESVVMKSIVEATNRDLKYAHMLSGKQVAGLLRFLIKLAGIRTVLEIGTFTGYATLAMAEALPDDGKVTTLDMNEKYVEIARKHFMASPHGQKINVVFGDARQSLSSIDGHFGLVFLDADKQYYPEYYQLMKPKLGPGGILVADNVFWSGGVLDPVGPKSRAVHRFNGMVRDDVDMETLMLPVRDGVLIARKVD